MTGWFDLVRLGLELLHAVVGAFESHGPDAASLRLKDVLPATLLTSLERRAAENKARQRYGP